MEKDELLTVEEAAEWLAVSKPTLWRMIRRGEIPVVRIAQRNIRIKLTDIEDYIAEHYNRRKDIL